MSRLSALAAVSAAAATLAACAVGPAYRTPAPAAGTEVPFASAQAPVFSSQAPPEAWWRLFASPVLDELVAEALAANKDLAIARANLAEVRASLAEARSGRLPATGLSASAASVRQQNLATGVFEEGELYGAGFDVAYELDLFGRVRRTVEAGRAEVGAAEAALDAARIAVAAETARAYADVCGANGQLAVARRTLALQQSTYDLTARQLENGRGTGLSVAQAAAQLESTRATLPPLETQRAAAAFRLGVLLGRPPAQVPAQALACERTPEVGQVLPVGDGASLLRRRPDVRQAERQLAAATARIGVATAALYPSVTLAGGISTSAFEAGDLGDDYEFNLGPLISWTFPNIASARARVAQADARAQAALAQFEKTNLVALQEAETALSSYARELDRRAALIRARDEGARAARLARLRYDAGADSFLNVLVAEQTLAELEARLAEAQAQTGASQIAVFKALGGGWGPPG
jgi:outer membrane protein, multidrug efflux system